MGKKISKRSKRNNTSRLTDTSRTSALKVLVVEDHGDSAEALALMLATMGHAAQVALSVHDAVRLCEREHFDLLVSDLHLGDGNGLQLMRELRTHRPEIKGIAISGDPAKDVALRTCGAGFSEHVKKPFDVLRLEEIINRVVDAKC